jgi:tellurite resistance protein TerC
MPVEWSLLVVGGVIFGSVLLSLVITRDAERSTE